MPVGDESMNIRFKNLLFFSLCLSLIFNYIPTRIQLNFIGGPVGNKLVIYPLIIGIIYTIWCEWKKKRIFVETGIFTKYCFVYISVSLLSLVLGLYTYPYWDLVLNGPVDQIEKLPKVLAFLSAHGIDISPKLLMSTWICVRQIKGLFLEVFWCFGGAYLVYCWYKDDWKKGLYIATCALISSIVIFLLYGFMDALYLYGNELAKIVLITVNPYLHPITTDNGWWPPLLWEGQLRSVFVEPSHVGNYLGLVVPFLLYYYLKRKRNALLFLIAAVSFIVVLTKARTAYAMMAGMLCLSIILILFLSRNNWKQVIAILCASIIGFYGGICFINLPVNNVNNKQEVNVATVIDDNLGSLAASDKRSNGARYALIKCNLRIAAQHPIFGVGSGLGLAYMLDNYTDDECNNQEVADWIRRSYKYGIFATGQGYGDAMNEYVTRLSQRGLVGLFVFLFPFLYIIYKLYREKGYPLERLCLIFVLITCLVAACNGSIHLIYAVWVPMGLAYAMCFGKDSSEKDVNERA